MALRSCPIEQAVTGAWTAGRRAGAPAWTREERALDAGTGDFSGVATVAGSGCGARGRVSGRGRARGGLWAPDDRSRGGPGGRERVGAAGVGDGGSSGPELGDVQPRRGDELTRGVPARRSKLGRPGAGMRGTYSLHPERRK